MKSIKRLAFFIRLQYSLSKKGLKIGIKLLRIITRVRLIHPFKWFNKTSSSKGDELRKVAEELKPMIINIGETLATKPEIVHETLKKVVSKLHDNSSPSTNKEHIITTKQSNEYPLDESVIEFIPNNRSTDHTRTENTENLEMNVKSLFDKINIAHFTGDKIAFQIESLIDKGIRYTKEWTNSQQVQAEYIHKESYASRVITDLSDFIQEIDELSLNVERLQAQVNQLMSGHEIN